MINPYLNILLVLVLYMTGWFLLALWRRRNDLADIAWGGGFIAAALTASLLRTGGTPRAWMAVLLVVLWGLRLAVHIALRNLGRGEDERYRKWREAWGSGWLLRSFLQVFLLQGFLIYLISLPVIRIVLADSSGWTVLMRSAWPSGWPGFISKPLGISSWPNSRKTLPTGERSSSRGSGDIRDTPIISGRSPCGGGST